MVFSRADWQISFGLFFAGQNIGLCNGKLKAMSGEELDQLPETELSSTVKNVMVLITKTRPISNCILLIQGCIYIFFYYFSGFHFLQNKSKAQTENHKGTKSLSNPLCASQKQDIRGGGGAQSSRPPGLPRQDQLKLKDCKTQTRTLALFTLKVLAFLLQIWPGSFGRH